MKTVDLTFSSQLILERWGNAGWTARRPGIDAPYGQGNTKDRAALDLFRQERGKTGPVTPQKSPRTMAASKTDRPRSKR